MHPKITVVTPSLNQGDFIEQTILSVLGQRYPDLEYWVIDGGSTDGTLDILRRYENEITGWISEPDVGQADAINKGFARAEGDIFCWLNSDDFYLPGTLIAVGEAMANGADLVYGDTISFSDKGKRCVVNRPPAYDRGLFGILDYIVQPSSFWTRSLWERTGPLDTSLHFAFDWEWFLRASEGARFEKVDRILSAYRFHSAHKSSTGGTRRGREIVEVANRHGDDAVKMHYNVALGRRRSLRRFELWCRKLEGRGFSQPEHIARWLVPSLWSLPRGCDVRKLRTCGGMLGH